MAGLGVLLGLSIAVVLWGSSASPLPPPPPLPGPLPSASPPSGMAVYQLPTGVAHRSAFFAYRGGSFFDKREFVMTALLVKHPRGDLLIDTGFGSKIDEHFQQMPLFFRAVTEYSRKESAARQLDLAGYDRKNLRGILLTHAHWDHVSGLPDFPGVPVMVTAEERKFIDEGGFLTKVIRSTPDLRLEEYAFEGGPYLGFPRSHDLYGDGSIVIVPAPGHTPGSVIVFVTLPEQQRLALVGDLVWQREGITLREERPMLQRVLGDHDVQEVRQSILRVSAITTRFPEMNLVPAHDSRGFSSLPVLPPGR